MPHKIQRIELTSYHLPLHCPFCGAKSYSADPDETADISPCRHTLFVADDEGFSFRSALFNKLMNIDEAAGNKLECSDLGIDAFTDTVCCADSIKFAILVPAPAFFGAYYGFSRNESE